MPDDLIKKIFEESEKAELLEAVAEELKGCRRIVVMFESPRENNMSFFQYYQMGFRQSYEVLGFLDWLKEMIMESDEEEE